ncbi:MAG: hypothetical protein PHP81_03710, partial [Patescibacteria group bacterium]|nr:hypothetical protein [Patescibacteria group bacterium]
QKLHVAGVAQLDSISFGVTPGESQTLALATVEYVNTKAGGAGGIETGIDGQTLRHNGTSWVANSLFYNSGTNIGIGTTNPGSLLTVANNQWLSARNGADTGIVNMFKVNTNNQIEVGAPLLIGPLEFAANSGLVSFLDMPVTSAAALGLPQGYVMKIDGNNILTVYGESNGSGGIQNARVGIGTASPSAGLDVQGDAFFGTVNKLKVQDLGGTYVAMQATLASSDATKKIIALNPWGGNVGIGTTVTSQKLHVNGGAQLDAISFGVTPGTTQDLALATVEYVNNTISGSGSFVPITGGTLQGPINMGNFDITNVNKLTAGTVDPLYRIKGINYSTFAPSVVGGVKEEYVGKIKIANRNNQGEYEAIIDFSKVEEGSDLWVWRQVVDFSQENVDVLITPYNSFANTYYKIENEKIVIRSSEPVSISYRLIGRRHDWQEWPTRAKDQTEKPSFIID